MPHNPMTNIHIFPPIGDRKHFPLLASGCDEPCAILMGCDRLVFLAPDDIALSSSLERALGRDWHMYGDTRWPSPSAWIEVPLNYESAPTNCGILVMRVDMPAGEVDPLAWCAHNNPLTQVLPHERSEDVLGTRLQMLRSQATSADNVAGPDDSRIASMQSYCIFHQGGNGQPRFAATYTDVLNVGGIPIPLYRMASVHSQDVSLCRLLLHSLFFVNEARLAGANLIAIPQFQYFGAIFLPSGQNNPKWAQFHPSRAMRTRPFLRATPKPTEMKDGILTLADFERVADITRRETCAHLLAFEREARPHDTALHQNSANAGLSAFIHRANGGAIYVLPDRLVEEFDNTDCSEVLFEDITLPFPNLFLKFTPPRPLLLADDAVVDGCYVVKQGDEYLFMLTSRLERVDYQHSLSVTCIDQTFSLHLPAATPGMSINAAVDAGIEDFLKANAPPEDDFSTTVERPDGTHTTVVDIRAESRQRRIAMFRSQEPVFRACLNIIVNAACFIAFRPDDISDGWEGEPPAELIAAANDSATSRSKRDRKRDALKRLEVGDFTRIRICGKNLFSERQDEGLVGSGKSPRAHWRRGHWRRQRYGVGLSLVTLRWIRPTIVKKDSGPVVEARLYEVNKHEESQ